MISCKRKTRDYYLEDSLKYTSGIDTGSIFIYQDSITNKFDTMVVTQSKLGTYYDTQDQMEPFYFQRKEFNLQNTNQLYDSSIIVIYFTADAMSKSFSTSFYFKSQNNSSANTKSRVYSEPFAYYSSELGNELIEENKPVNMFNSIVIKGNVFTAIFENVYSFHKIDSSATDFCHTYYSLESGLIKFTIKTVNDTIVKELVFANIKRN